MRKLGGDRKVPSTLKQSWRNLQPYIRHVMKSEAPSIAASDDGCTFQNDRGTSKHIKLDVMGVDLQFRRTRLADALFRCHHDGLQFKVGHFVDMLAMSLIRRLK